MEEKSSSFLSSCVLRARKCCTLFLPFSSKVNSLLYFTQCAFLGGLSLGHSPLPSMFSSCFSLQIDPPSLTHSGLFFPLCVSPRLSLFSEVLSFLLSIIHCTSVCESPVEGGRERLSFSGSESIFFFNCMRKERTSERKLKGEKGERSARCFSPTRFDG
mmetsp:Transcript_52358/g.102487  ORF Transcript_52358/g.102487 Transcript_52358/m.102487 type:complete len:159 (-) Transcript_52358:571-1047(-)